MFWYSASRITSKPNYRIISVTLERNSALIWAKIIMCVCVFLELKRHKIQSVIICHFTTLGYLILVQKNDTFCPSLTSTSRALLHLAVHMQLICCRGTLWSLVIGSGSYSFHCTYEILKVKRLLRLEETAAQGNRLASSQAFCVQHLTSAEGGLLVSHCSSYIKDLVFFLQDSVVPCTYVHDVCMFMYVCTHSSVKIVDAFSLFLKNQENKDSEPSQRLRNWKVSKNSLFLVPEHDSIVFLPVRITTHVLRHLLSRLPVLVALWVTISCNFWGYYVGWSDTENPHVLLGRIWHWHFIFDR